MTADRLRLGPRPLALHAFAGWRAHMLAIAAAGGADALGDKTLETRIHSALAAGDTPGRLAFQTMLETGGRWADFWDGVAKYRAHPFRRSMPSRPTLTTMGRTQVLDFAPESDGPPLLAIPSLVNGSEVLDLAPGRSLMHAFAEAGRRPFLIDWGAPEADAARWSVDRYVAERLEPILTAVRSATGRPVLLVGYCMGGLLAAALASRRTDDVAGLALLATPWNFHAPSPESAKVLAGMQKPFAAAAALTGAVPVDVLQTLFFALDPTLAARKFRSFAKLDQDSPAAELFVAMEDWVNGGPPLAAPVAETVVTDWYGENATHAGKWRVDGRVVDNKSYAGPTLVAAPSRDRIVPAENARAYGDGAPHAQVLDVDAGHVGMIVGDRAQDRLWRPLLHWIESNAAC